MGRHLEEAFWGLRRNRLEAVTLVPLTKQGLGVLLVERLRHTHAVRQSSLRSRSDSQDSIKARGRPDELTSNSTSAFPFATSMTVPA